MFVRLMVILFVLVLWVPPQVRADEQSMGTIIGRVEWPDLKNYRGVVSVWDERVGRVPDPRRYIIVPFLTSSISSSGDFEIKVPPGKYYVGAVVRQSSGPDTGPPREGDLVFMTPDRNGGVVVVTLAPGEKMDLGVRNLGWCYQGMAASGPLVITGRVTDTQGSPVPGLLVFGFGDASLSLNPLAVSQRTDEDGRYALRLDRPSQVYLRARDKYGGGAPVEGEYMGVYGGPNPIQVTVSGDQPVEGADISVFIVPKRKDGGEKGAPTVK